MVSPDEENQPMPSSALADRHQLVRRLAAGQMGEVFEAEDLLLRRRVAVKVIRREYAGSLDFTDRLRLEAQAVAAVAEHSPHVVAALDLGQTPDGRAYVVFERLTGRTLRDELQERGFLPVGEAVALMQQLLDGLAAAHDAGIIHRDIKHENVFLCDAGRSRGGRVLKILDFGIAKVVNPAAAGAPKPLALPTGKGMMVGTPRFLAPEQVLGKSEVDPRADLYSAGILLYMLLAGRDPFAHHQAMFDLLRAQLHETPAPPSAHAPQPIPEALDGIVMRALAKAPEHRFPDARAFAEALAQVGLPRPAPRPRWLETERMDLTAFRAPPVTRTTRLPTASALAADPTVATLQLPPLGILPAGLAPRRRRFSRAQLMAIMLLAALILIEAAALALRRLPQ
jgi:serine/threonine-protein kinase